MKRHAHHGCLAIQLSETEHGGGGVMENVKEGCKEQVSTHYIGKEIDQPKGFFLRAKKTVSSSSRYLM
jgi:hypothetical protein